MSLINMQNIIQKTNSTFQIYSKWRIIQKNLVHIQGFPQEMNNEEILSSPEYFGQYGLITRICLVPIKGHRTYNSAYITFETEEQAAYCILAVDSIKIKDNLVRAFFGTTKFCNNFLKGYQCINKNCKFLHCFDNNNKDIVINDIKFGYSEHINLAKKIIGFGTPKSFEYIKKNCNLKINHILPDIRHIYSIQHINEKNKNHRRKQSTSSNNSTNNSINNSFNSINNNINDLIKENLEDKKEINIKKEEKSPIKLSKNKNINKIIDGLIKRRNFFKKFEKYEFGKSLLRTFEKDFFLKFFENNEKEINDIINF